MSDLSVKYKITHYQRCIDESADDLEWVECCISRLNDLPVTVKHLEITGIGRTVNQFSVYGGSVGQLARFVVAKWKRMVIHDGEEDEACVLTDSEPDIDSDESEEDDEVYSFSVIQEGDALEIVENERSVESREISSREGDETSMKIEHDNNNDAMNLKESSSYESETERETDGSDQQKRKLERSIEDVEQHKKTKISEKAQDNMQSIISVDNEEKSPAGEVSDRDKCTQSQITHNTSPSKDKRKEEKDKSRDGSSEEK